MRWLRTLVIFDKGDIVRSPDWCDLHASYVRAIDSIDHPSGSGKLTLREKAKLPSGQWQRNGVGYLRAKFLSYMQEKEGWSAERNVDLRRDRAQPPIVYTPH